jgi:hypothetical protein
MLPLATSENWLLPALLVVAENSIVLVEPEKKQRKQRKVFIISETQEN